MASCAIALGSVRLCSGRDGIHGPALKNAVLGQVLFQRKFDYGYREICSSMLGGKQLVDERGQIVGSAGARLFGRVGEPEGVSGIRGWEGHQFSGRTGIQIRRRFSLELVQGKKNTHRRRIVAFSSSTRRFDDQEAESSKTTAATDLPQDVVSFPTKYFLFQDAVWRFLRPHTIRGTVIGTVALVARALIENPSLINWYLMPKALRGLFALLCGNGYIVGINQIYDVQIDAVNKPFLPIAAGDLGIPAAWLLVLSFAGLGIGIVATNFGPLITGLYCFALLIGGLYSVPPFRLKRFPIPAFLTIATVRGFLLNFGVYYATRAAIGLPFVWSPSIVFITCFVTVFATVIAITKDMPDVEGDMKYNISTFATRIGIRNLSIIGAGLLLGNYIGAITAALLMPQAFNSWVVITTHGLLGVSLIAQTWLLDSAKYSKEAAAVFYRFIWNLFYTEYILLPFI